MSWVSFFVLKDVEIELVYVFINYILTRSRSFILSYRKSYWYPIDLIETISVTKKSDYQLGSLRLNFFDKIVIFGHSKLDTVLGSSRLLFSPDPLLKGRDSSSTSDFWLHSPS